MKILVDRDELKDIRDCVIAGYNKTATDKLNELIHCVPDAIQLDKNPEEDIKERLDYCEDSIDDIEDRWAKCHNAIVEILDMLIKHGKEHVGMLTGDGWELPSVSGAEELKAKLESKK